MTVNALHPGVVSTKLLTDGFKMKGRDSLAEGSATSVKLALDPSLVAITGRYFAYEKESDTAPSAKDAELARRFYDESCRLTGVTPL